MINFSPALFGRVRRQFINIDDYPYIVMDFCNDLELEFPEGKQWDALGKILRPLIF